MTSRMEKYYKSTESAQRRAFRNEDLYKTMYDDETYSNIEGIVETPKVNEIDINKIRELIHNHEAQQKNTRQLVRKAPDLEMPEDNFLEEESIKNYDIREILDKAKDSRDIKEPQYHSLKNTEYDILKGIKIREKKEETTGTGEELKDLINTITNTSMLNKLGNTELSLDMFQDLKSNTMVGNSESIKNLLEQTKEVEKTGEMDKSFYTSSLNFKDKDFEQLQDIHTSLNKNNKLMKTVLIVGGIIIALIIIFLIIYFIKK